MIFEGAPVVELMKKDLESRVLELRNSNHIPTILLIRVGNHADDVSYEKGIVRNCNQLGIRALSDPMPENSKEADVLSHIERANSDKEIDGIMIFRPLPSHINEEKIQKAINPLKDVDCISNENLEKVFKGNANLAPCTAQAVINMLKFYTVPLEGKNIVIVGRSTVVGKPLAMLLLDENPTVTICHSKTENLDKYTRRADVVITCIGKSKFFGKRYFNENSVIIDVGMSYNEKEKKLCGDVDFDKVLDTVNSISPSKGGVGVITTTVLLSNLINFCERKAK